MTDTLDETAQQIADQGREALIARLRPAFEEAAAAHSDVLDLAPDQLDAMVERAVERADGLQWRRALASVATEQLGITLGEALGHPAVARAQELAGAPSYEESLAQLGPLPGTASAPPAEATEPAEAPAAAEVPDSPTVDEPEAADEEPSDHVEDVEDEAPMATVEEVGTLAPPPPADEAEAEAEHELEQPEATPEAAEDIGVTGPETRGLEEDYEDHVSPEQTELPVSTAEYETAAPYEDEEYEELDDALRVAVIHLGGIANLAPAERNIELQMSEDGLDIVRGGGEILGRLDWDQVKALEVPTPKGRRRMRRGGGTHLIVRTARGDASFEVPEVSAPELEKHLAPIVARHVRGDEATG